MFMLMAEPIIVSLFRNTAVWAGPLQAYSDALK
jgi:hypothetical protein